MKYFSKFINENEKKIFFLFFIFIWAYLWLKAYYVPLVNDELGTFYFYVQTKNFLPYLSHWDANNHILYSAISTLFYTLFGDSEIVIRLASLLSFPLFFFFILKISEYLSNRIIRWGFLITLCFTHNFTEFFFLARGYGLSMSLLFGSIYYLLRTIDLNNRKDYYRSLIFGILAISANLTLLNTFLIIFGFLLLKFIISAREQKHFNYYHFLLIILTGFIPVILAVKYSLDLRERGLLYYGNLNGFFEVSVKSISNLLTGFSNNVFPYIFTALFLLLSGLFISSVVKNNFLKNILTKNNTFYLLLFLNISAILVLAKGFKVNYPEDRTGIYLYPFLVAGVCFAADYLIKKTGKKATVFIMLPFLFFPFHFGYTMNLTHSALFYTERIPKSYFEKIYSEHQKGEFPPSVGAYRCCKFTWDYYNYRHKGTMGALNETDYPDLFSEYQIGNFSENPLWRKYYDSLGFDEATSYHLLKRKHFLKKNLIFQNSAGTKDEFSEEFFNLIELKADSLTGKLLYVGFKFTIKSDEVPFDTWIVTDVADKNNKSLIYKFIKLNCMKLNYDGSTNNFINGYYLNKLPGDAFKITSYVWNIHKKPYSLNGECFIYNAATDY